MANAPQDSTSDHTRTLSQELLLSLIMILVQNPEADLMSAMPESYTLNMETCGPVPLPKVSKLADLNQRTFSNLLKRFVDNPSACLVQPTSTSSYQRRWKNYAKGQKKPKRPENVIKDTEVTEPFYSLIDKAQSTSFEILFPLSSTASALLEKDSSTKASSDIVNKMKQIIRSSDCLWSGMFGDFAAKLSDEIVVKVALRSQVNHHIAIEHIKEHAPDITAPKPHGLIRLGMIKVLFISYVPRCLLSKVWPTLAHEEKYSIQQQFKSIFTRLRKLVGEKRLFGTIDGSGIRDVRGAFENFTSEETILTASAFKDWFLSSRPLVSKTYVRLFEGLIQPDQEPVLTHCDFRAGNVIVQSDVNGRWMVSGILDWEEAEFYPSYWESVKSTRNMRPHEEDDWYLYLPKCIAPKTFAQPWLADYAMAVTVDRLLAWIPRSKRVQRGKK